MSEKSERDFSQRQYSSRKDVNHSNRIMMIVKTQYSEMKNSRNVLTCVFLFRICYEMSQKFNKVFKNIVEYLKHYTLIFLT